MQKYYVLVSWGGGQTCFAGRGISHRDVLIQNRVAKPIRWFQAQIWLLCKIYF